MLAKTTSNLELDWGLRVTFIELFYGFSVGVTGSSDEAGKHLLYHPGDQTTTLHLSTGGSVWIMYVCALVCLHSLAACSVQQVYEFLPRCHVQIRNMFICGNLSFCSKTQVPDGEKKRIFPYYAVVTMAQCIIASERRSWVRLGRLCVVSPQGMKNPNPMCRTNHSPAHVHGHNMWALGLGPWLPWCGWLLLSHNRRRKCRKNLPCWTLLHVCVSLLFARTCVPLVHDKNHSTPLY